MMKRIFSKISIAAIAVRTLIVSLAYTPDYFEISKQLDIFTNVFRSVNLYYVDETEPGELMDEAIVSMLSSLDPYTNYIPEERVEDYKIQTTGNYGGIGASIRQRNGKLIVTNPYEGFSADKAGLMAGDIIKEVDGKSVVGKSTSDVSKILKGRKFRKLNWEHLKKMGVALNRAKFFILCDSPNWERRDLDADRIRGMILQNSVGKFRNQYSSQLSLFN